MGTMSPFAVWFHVDGEGERNGYFEEFDPENDPAQAFVLLGELPDGAMITRRQGIWRTWIAPGTSPIAETENLKAAICDAWIAWKEAENE